jgi:NAD(P)-dependent dehydrogenase (short-subunit alcohol dehydrogenase family)
VGRFQKKVCIVTGAAQGIGLATVRRLAAEGARVFALDIADAPEHIPSVEWMHCDVTSLDQWESTINSVESLAGPPRVLINNAGGVGSYDELASISIDDWDRVIELNQRSVFLGMRTALPSMLEGGEGSIVNVSSKGAVTMMTKNAAATYANRGIRVNSVHPGFIWTPMTEAQDADISQGLIDKTPMARAGLGDEVAAGIAFLASEDASFITGVQLLIDGGFTTI